MYDDFQRFEKWSLDLATKPTVQVFMITFICLFIIALFHPKPWTRSHIAWIVFALVNITVWAYFNWIKSIKSAEWQLHIQFFITLFAALSGPVLVILLFGKYVLGWEDDIDNGLHK